MNMKGTEGSVSGLTGNQLRSSGHSTAQHSTAQRITTLPSRVFFSPSRDRRPAGTKPRDLLLPKRLWHLAPGTRHLALGTLGIGMIRLAPWHHISTSSLLLCCRFPLYSEI